MNIDVSVSFKSEGYTYQESDETANVVVALTGESAVDVVVLVEGGKFDLLISFCVMVCNVCLTEPSTQMKICPVRVKFNSTVTFAPGGPKEKTVFAVIPNDDIALEDNEVINVSLTVLSPASGVMFGDFSNTLITIDDDDCKFSIVRQMLPCL